MSSERVARAPGRDNTVPRDFYLTLLQEFPALIWRANTDGQCDWFNTAWLEFTGRTLEQEYGDGWAESVYSEDLGQCVSIWRESFAQHAAFVMEYRMRRHDGVFRWIRDFGRPFYGPEAEFLGYIGACYDITDMRVLAEQLDHLANHDVLTGLPNRRAFSAEIERAIALARRGADSTVLFADVDRFKACNDQFGHEFGDEMLCNIGQAMKSAVREVDMVARVGGDEFGVVLHDQAPPAVEEVVKRLRAAVVATGNANGCVVDLSIGAARVTASADVSTILSEADCNMYAEKRSHLNDVV